MKKQFLFSVAISAALMTSAETLLIEGERTISDADFDTSLSGITEIALADKNAQLTFDLENDHEYSGTVSGSGKIVKSGNGCLTLTDTEAKSYYLLTGGWLVSAGTLTFPQCAGNHFPGRLEIGSGATVITSGGTFAIDYLLGAGTLTNAIDNVKVIPYAANFAGLLRGNNMDFRPQGVVKLTGTESDFSSGMAFMEGNARVEAESWGMKNSPSSIGKHSSVSVRQTEPVLKYTGTVDSECDKTFILINNLGHFHLDAGDYGGLTLSGGFKIYAEGSTKFRAMQSVVFEGSNTVHASVFSGSFAESGRTEDGATYITKRGPGTWRFTDNDARKNRGTIAVEEGKLEFTSVAETNVVCSLGLATRLASDYSAIDWDSLRTVDYAILLGTDTTVGTLDFVGAAESKTMTRPIALKGDGRLSNNGTAALKWSQIAPLGSAAVSLILAGENTDANEVNGVTDGEGTLSIVKEGAGTWNGHGVDISGDIAVKGGTFKLPAAPNYDYFRWTIKGHHGAYSCIYLSEFALYDADGNRLNLNPTIVQKGTAASALNPHEACLASAENCDKQGTSTATGSDIYKLFDDGKWTYGILMTTYNTVPVKGKENSYLSVLMRLAANSKAVASYDIRGGEIGWGETRGVSCWSLEGSNDGVNWHLLSEVEDFEPPFAANCQWYKDGNGGQRFATSATYDADLDNATEFASLEVAPGATFEAGVTTSFEKLVIDASTGGGTIRNVSFGASGTLNVVRTSPYQRNLNMTYDQVTGLDNLKNWTLQFNGKPAKSGCSVEVVDGQLQLNIPGLFIIFK